MCKCEQAKQESESVSSAVIDGKYTNLCSNERTTSMGARRRGTTISNMIALFMFGLAVMLPRAPGVSLPNSKSCLTSYKYSSFSVRLSKTTWQMKVVYEVQRAVVAFASAIRMSTLTKVRVANGQLNT